MAPIAMAVDDSRKKPTCGYWRAASPSGRFLTVDLGPSTVMTIVMTVDTTRRESAGRPLSTAGREGSS
jgi:hypothetical protein